MVINCNMCNKSNWNWQLSTISHHMLLVFCEYRLCCEWMAHEKHRRDQFKFNSKYAIQLNYFNLCQLLPTLAEYFFSTANENTGVLFTRALEWLVFARREISQCVMRHFPELSSSSTHWPITMMRGSLAIDHPMDGDGIWIFLGFYWWISFGRFYCWPCQMSVVNRYGVLWFCIKQFLVDSQSSVKITKWKVKGSYFTTFLCLLTN